MMNSLELKVSSSYYTNEIYILFKENPGFITEYEIFRNGRSIAKCAMDEKGEPANDKFVRPTLFDHDKRTRLFFKDSDHQYMYTDTEAEKDVEYEYYIKYKLWDGTVKESERITKKIEI